MAMLKKKHITISIILVCLIVVSPMAKAQLLGNGGLLGGDGGLLGFVGGVVDGSSGLLGGDGFRLRFGIQGVVFCTHNGGISLNTRSTPAFANADVQVQCGKQNRVISRTTTNAAGIFSIPMNSNHQMSLSTLLSGCKLAVTTPLTNCNTTLPSVGSLVSPLTVIGSTVSQGILHVINLAPTGFLHIA